MGEQAFLPVQKTGQETCPTFGGCLFTQIVQKTIIMKEKWEIKKFESCINKVIYTNKIQKNDFLPEGNYPIVSQEEGLINGFWTDEKDVFKIKKPIGLFGDHTRILKYIDFDFVLGADGVKILEPIDNVDSKFLLYYLTWFDVPSLGYSRHYKLLKEISIPIPPLPIQESIIKELDVLYRLKDLQEQQLTEYDNLAKSTFYSMFGDPIENEKGWEMLDLIDVVHLQRGHDLPISKRKEGNIPIYGSNGVVGYHNEMKKESGIITGRSGTIGKVFYSNHPFWPLNTTLYSINTNGNNIIYLTFLLNEFKLDRFYNGTGVPTLNRNVIHKEKIINVPLSLQADFANRIEKIEAQKDLVKQGIAETQLLIDYTMDKYFG